MDVCCECCVLSVDQSSREVLPTVVRRRVWSRNLVNEEAMAHCGLLSQKQKKNHYTLHVIQGDTKTGTFEKPNKNWRNPRKKIIDRNWTITTCLLRDSNPNYQCLKITSCRWRPPPRMHSFTATAHFKSSRSFVSSCVCCMLCRMRHLQ